MIRLHEIFEEPAEDTQDPVQDFAFYRAVQFAFGGIILFHILLHLVARYVHFTELSPICQLFMGQLPYVAGGTGGALLGLRKSLRQYGWKKVLDMPTTLPCAKPLFYKELMKWTLLLIFGCILLNAIASVLLKAAGFQQIPRQLIEIVGTDAGLSFWIPAFISAVAVAPVTEEILFRRVLYRGFKSLHFSHAGLVVAFLFSLSHGLPQAFVSYLLFSLVLQRACHKGSLWMAIGMHAGFNLVMFAMLIGKIFFFST